MALGKSLVFRLIFKQRRQAMRAGGIARCCCEWPYRASQACSCCRTASAYMARAAAPRQSGRIRETARALPSSFSVSQKRSRRPLAVVQRAAEKTYACLRSCAALRQPGDGLVHHGLIDAGGHVLLARALIEQRLNIALGENAAARGDGVDARVLKAQQRPFLPRVIFSSAAIWSINAPVPPAQLPFMRSSSPPGQKR